ncbi:MAG: recombinase family protein [Candidatus Woesearchaeota archaeon]|nr:MAG: recombinase family protein [Candidatus Woesearchaeota archaeon]
MGKPRVACYVRVSTQEQAIEGISLGAQKEKLNAYCTLRDWEVYNIYEDAGFSAGNTKRPAFEQLMKDVESYDILLVYKIDRFSRNLKDLILTLDELKKHKVNFTSVTEQIDTTTAMGEAFFQIIGVFAQLERGMVKERVELAFDKKIAAGEVLNRAPFGYKFDEGTLIVDEDQAKIVKDVFTLRAQGVNYRTICEKFKFATSTFYEIIKNPTYAGYLRFRGKLIKANHEPIISVDQFNVVNKMQIME